MEMLPALIWIDCALIKTSLVSSAMRVPSMSINLAGFGFISIKTVHFALI